MESFAKKYGACIRLGVVTTDMPLIPDKKEEWLTNTDTGKN